MVRIQLFQSCLLLGLTLLSFLFFSCNKSDQDLATKNNIHDCEFIQNDENMDGLIDETERTIMDDCFQSKFTSKNEIESNLIGEWELIGHGEGWTSSPSKPCSFITVSEDQLIFEYKDANLDTATSHDWQITENSNGIFTIKVTPEYPVGINISIYCDKNMYGDATPRDGNMYLYQKIN